MPIGTVDYVSTLPWNSTMNPWPLYSEVQVDEYDGNDLIFSDTLPLSVFDPVTDRYNIGGTTFNLMYAKYIGSDLVTLLYGLSSIIPVFLDNYWLYSNAVTDNVSVKNNTSRAIPMKSVGESAGWFFGDMSVVAITPVYAQLNPWEYRRRRTLEYI